MFCPKCGQSQVSNVIRFCPRCGFPLGGVVELLTHDGVLAPTQPPTVAQLPSPRRQGMRQGVAIMLVGLFLIPLLALLHPLIGLAGEYTLLGVIVFLAGLLRLIFAAIFADGSPPPPSQFALQAQPTPPGHFLDPRAQAAQLPPGEFRSTPTLFPRRQDTAEIPLPPTSVTDHTTRLLAREDDASER